VLFRKLVSLLLKTFRWQLENRIARGTAARSYMFVYVRSQLRERVGRPRFATGQPVRISVVAAWLAVAPVVLPGQTSTTARCDLIQYRFIDQGATFGAPRHRSLQDGQSYALRDSMVIDGRGIAEIRVLAHGVGGDTTWDVTAQLTPAGTSAMAAATGRNLGETLAVLWGDTILEHGVLQTALRSRVPVRLGVTRAEADSLAVRARRASGTSCHIP
jgi:hypothetical protein